MRGLLYCCLVPILASSAALVNRTIDDQSGDEETHLAPLYEPAVSGYWQQGPTCTVCAIRPATSPDEPGAVDSSKVVDGTWHDSTYHTGDPEHTIRISFTGQAVYVFNLLANTQLPGVITFTNLSFTLDDAPAGSYSHFPDSAHGILYGVPVFSNASIPPGRHTLKIVAGGPTPSLILFDYIIYTVDDDSDDGFSTSSVDISLPTSSPVSKQSSEQLAGPSPSSSRLQPGPGAGGSNPTVEVSDGQHVPMGSIIGGVVGAVALLALLGVLLCRIRRRRLPVHTPTRVEHVMKEPASSLVPSETATKTGAGRLGEQAGRSGYSTTDLPPAAISTLVGRASFSSGFRPPPTSGGGFLLPTRGLPESDRAMSHFVPSVPREVDVSRRLPGRSPFVEGNACNPSPIPDAPPAPYTQRGTSTLRAQVAGLRSELLHLRSLTREMHQLFVESPPRYEERE
ncbi:hypothetical protein BV20DRAFT_757191 [Pilatotrama ljubarskyi]|nr:hypothetical protein BV20DRAFT_757191 [Pilatotrama ljubarskyi]